MKQTQHFESSLDTDSMPLDGQHVMDYALGSEAQMKATDGFLNYEDDKLVKYLRLLFLLYCTSCFLPVFLEWPN